MRNNGLNFRSVHKANGIRILKSPEWFRKGMRKSVHSVLAKLHQTRQKMLKDNSHAYIDYSS